MATGKSCDIFYQFKIWLLDSPLPIWRRILIRSDAPLNLLQEVTQIAMGWWDLEDYEFQIGGRRFRNFDEKRARGIEGDLIDICELVSVPGQKIRYIYDLKARWEHDIELEAVQKIEYEGKKGLPSAHCYGGKRACPPEGLGGVTEYRRFINIIEDPSHANRDETLKLARADQFDPDAFDAGLVNLRLYTLDAEMERYARDIADRRKKNKLVVLKPRVAVN